jgi:hypothetical protein
MNALIRKAQPLQELVIPIKKGVLKKIMKMRRLRQKLILMMFLKKDLRQIYLLSKVVHHKKCFINMSK